MAIFVSGSIARDLIMDFPGRFRDFIDPKKIHVLNLSFAVENLKENIGGTAGNISYNLSLLGESPDLVANLGSDQIGLLDYFRGLKIRTWQIQISKHRPTAAAYIITDKDDNQITGFHAGAMNENRKKMPKAKKGDWAIIAAESPRNMIRLAKFYSRKGVNYIFDPGQQITSLTNSDLRMAIRGARILIGNDYEIGLMLSSLRGGRGGGRRSNLTEIAALPSVARNDNLIVVRTLGPKGSEIYTSGRGIKIGIARPRRVLDPTGAGDGYRAGFLKGLILGYDIKTCGQLGATVASFAVEEYGTQKHRFNWKSIAGRHYRNFQNKL